MNNKRSPGEQLILIALLSFSAFWLSQTFFGNKNQGNRTDKPAPPVAQAFQDLKATSKEAALKEISTLQAAVTNNGNDEYSYWARLRVGLLQQYVLQNALEARKSYEEIIDRQNTEPVDAQALFQKGDLLWRISESTQATAAVTGNVATNGVTTEPALSSAAIEQQQSVLRNEGATTLEQLVTRARGNNTFLQSKVFVPGIESWRGDPLQLPATWDQTALSELLGKGTTVEASPVNTSDPRAVLPRVDANYAQTWLYKLFDAVVQWFGNQPSYSYGLALLILAIVTRLLMQPLIRKQYDSMKGMSLIAPEMKKIQDKYKGKTDQESQMRMMKEIREVQKAHGVNPMGCGLSLLIQMPVFFFFVLPLINHYQAKMELVGAHFLWIESLARPDIPLLVLYGISMFVSVRLSSMPPTDEQQRQMQRITTIMSPMFALFLWSYPSAFIMYWLTYNVLSTGIQWKMMKASDPTKSVVKTLMGTAPPPVIATVDGSTPSNGAIPPRPSSSKTSASKTVKMPALDAGESSTNGSHGEEEPALEVSGASKKSSSGSSSTRRRRRRR